MNKLLLNYVLEFLVYECHTCKKKWRGEDTWICICKFIFCSEECYLFH